MSDRKCLTINDLQSKHILRMKMVVAESAIVTGMKARQPDGALPILCPFHVDPPDRPEAERFPHQARGIGKWQEIEP